MPIGGGWDTDTKLAAEKIQQLKLIHVPVTDFDIKEGVAVITATSITAAKVAGQQRELARGERHPSSERFHQLLVELGELHDRKQRDYGSAADPFANVRASQLWGTPAWVGALMRLNDKVVRLQRFARDHELANESAEDSMRDIAVYALIALVLYEEAARTG